jgi:restriction endonuclease S subunit
LIQKRDLRSIAEVLRGTIPASEFDDDGTDRFFGMTEIGRAGQGPIRRVTLADTDEKAVRLQEGDVALVLMGRIGTSTLIDEETAGAILGRECAALRASSPGVLPEWLYAWTRSPDFADQARRYTTGTTMPRLGIRDLLGFVIPVPAIDQQEKITETLARFQAAKKATSETLANLEHLEQLEVTLAFRELQE